MWSILMLIALQLTSQGHKLTFSPFFMLLHFVLLKGKSSVRSSGPRTRPRQKCTPAKSSLRRTGGKFGRLQKMRFLFWRCEFFSLCRLWLSFKFLLFWSSCTWRGKMTFFGELRTSAYTGSAFLACFPAEAAVWIGRMVRIEKMRSAEVLKSLLRWTAPTLLYCKLTECQIQIHCLFTSPLMHFV